MAERERTVDESLAALHAQIDQLRERAKEVPPGASQMIISDLLRVLDALLGCWRFDRSNSSEELP